MARDPGHGRGEDRRVLRRPGQAACDDALLPERPFELRSFSTDTSLRWVARRWAKFALHTAKGMLRSVTAPASSSYNGIEDDAQEEAAKWVQNTSARG